ncbi:MAG: alpha/beta hydrolase [Romboutsia sp.]|uniref:alpha/beta hydrolase n=1 Tax=Romboutsia sp. TaxID=1965302 RepID=UPI003F3C7A34
MSKEISSKEKQSEDTFSITMELQRPLFIDEVIEEDKTKDMKVNIKKKIIMAIGVGITAIVIGTGLWLNKTYEPKELAMQALTSGDSVKVTTIDDYISFTPKNETPTKGFIFYPGAKVEPESYAPICREIAENGYEVIILDVPLNIALLGQNKAQDVMNDYPDITHWAVGGHSLGGVAAANFAAKDNQVDGVVLLASYPMGDSLKQMAKDVLSIWGSKDGVVNFKDLIKAKEKLPKDTEFIEIEGANHSQFGDYGLQNGDHDALISNHRQMEITSENIVKFLENLN